MNNNDIETMSISAIQRQIALCKLLSPYVREKDKEPCWDGFIYIHQDEKKVKGSAVNRVAVQVKGTEQTDLSKESITARIDTADLRSYLNVHGTMYFVVYINGFESKIYYVDLTPVRIKDILGRSIEQQQSIAVNLQELPQNTKDIENIIINFADHCSRQASFSNIKLVSMDELSNSKEPLRFSLFYSGHGIEDPFGAMLKYGTYLYIDSDSFPIPQPIGTIPSDMVFSETVQESITIAGKEYYNCYKRTRTKDILTIEIGASFMIIVNYKKKEYVSIKYKSSDQLRILARDLAFIIGLIDNSGFELNGLHFKFSPADAELESFELEKQRENLLFYQKAVQVLDELNCSGNINLSMLSEVHIKHLHYLVDAFIDKLPVRGLNPNLPLLVNVCVSDYKFALVFEHIKDESGAYSIHNLFNTALNVFSVDESGEKYQVSQYIILTREDMLALTNFKGDVILQSFKALPSHPLLYARANFLLLEILSAYDMKPERKDLLDLVREMAEWLVAEASDDALSKEIRRLNLYQTISRLRTLNESERSAIVEITTHAENPPEVLFGAYLLLDQQDDAKREFKRMNEKTQEEFRKYPIYRFYRD